MTYKLIENLPSTSTPWVARWTNDFDSGEWIKEIYAKSATARNYWGVKYIGNNKETILLLTMQIIRSVRNNEGFHDLHWFKQQMAKFKLEFDAAWEAENTTDYKGYYKLDRNCALFADADNILNTVLDYNFVV